MSAEQHRILALLVGFSVLFGIYSEQILATSLQFLLVCLGAGMNHLVIAANGKKMPVLIRDGERMEGVLTSPGYCRLSTTTKFPWLADVIKIEPTTMNRITGSNFFAYASIGDFVQFAAVPVALWIFASSLISLVTAFV